MADIICHICNRPNDANAERCWYCQAVLHSENANQPNKPEDWLDSFRDGTPPDASGQPSPNDAQSDESANEEVPDWLARIRQREQEENPVSGGETNSPDTSDEEVPDWLKGIEAETSQEPQPVSNAGDQPKEEEDADWLKKLEGWQPATPVVEPTDSEPSEPAVEPNSEEPTQPKTQVESASNGENPDWLQEFMQDSNTPTEVNAEPDAVNPAPFIESPESQPFPILEISNEESVEEKPGEEIPIIEEPVESTVVSELEKEKPIQTESAAEEPDWLSEFKALNPDQDLASQVIPVAQPDNLPKSAFNDEEVLDWMSTPEATPAAQQEPEAEAEPVDGIEKASLPPWLQALRPNKKAAEPDVQAKPDAKSPLAGIEEALGGGGLNQLYTRPETYGSNLTISDSQNARAQALRNVIAQSNWDHQEPIEAKKPNTWVLRLLICILVLAAVILPTFIHTLPTQTPTLYPPEVVDTFNGLNDLTAESPILVAADFDGSLYGELSLASQAVIEQLMSKGISLTTLSTTPVGATLMQEILAKAELNQTGYAASEKTGNLGYLPGGSMGLQALAGDPISAMPLNTQLQPAWQNENLKNIKTLADFGALIVITENADTARYWIEQVQPVLGDTPIYVIISAQSAPLLQPYYDSQQINGYIAGMNGAAVFEQLAGKPGPASQNYPAYQVTLILAAVLVFLGGVITLITPKPGKERAGASKP